MWMFPGGRAGQRHPLRNQGNGAHCSDKRHHRSHKHACAMAQTLTLNDVEAAVKVGDTAVVEAGLVQGGGALLNIEDVKEDWFIAACDGGHMEVAQLLLQLKGERAVNVHAWNETAFWCACKRGRAKVVRLLLGLSGGQRVHVHAGNEVSFRHACLKGCIDVVVLLLGLGGDRAVNVRKWNGWAFRPACENGQLDVVALLLAHRSAGGAPAAAKTLRRGGEWGYVVKDDWRVLEERPVDQDATSQQQ